VVKQLSLMLPCAGLLEHRGLGPGLLKSMFTAENFIMQVVLVYLQPFRCNSFLKCAQTTVKICKKITKIPLLLGGGGEVQGRSRSPMLINLKVLLPVLVTISNMYSMYLTATAFTLNKPIAAK